MKPILKGYMNKNFVDKNKFIKIAKSQTQKYLGKKYMLNSLESISNVSSRYFIKPINFKFVKGKLNSSYKFLPKAFPITTEKLESYFEQIIDAISKLQDQPISKYKFNPCKKINYFLKHVKDKLHNYKKYSSEIKNNFKYLEKKYRSVLSHNDLNQNNLLIKDNELVIVDYDTLGTNCYLFDYVSFITESLAINDLNIEIDNFKKILIEKNIVTLSEITDVDLMFSSQCFLWSLWANYFYEVEKDILFKLISDKMFSLYIKKDS